MDTPDLRPLAAAQPQEFFPARWSLWVVALLALALRLVALEQQNLWFDETLTIHVANQPYARFPELTREGESGKPPLYHALVHEWLRFGTSDGWLRLTSALPGAAACVVAALFGAELFRDRRGWWVGLLLAISPLHVWYSQELRMYALLSLCGFSALWFHLRFLRTRSHLDLAGYGVCAALACYSFTYGCFVLGVACLVTLLRGSKLPRVVLLQVAAVSGLAFALFIPWILRIATMAAAGEGFHSVIKGSPYEAAGFALYNLGFGSTLGPTIESLRLHKAGIFRAEPLASALMLSGLALLVVILACGAIQAWRRARDAFWFAVISLLIFGECPRC